MAEPQDDHSAAPAAAQRTVLNIGSGPPGIVDISPVFPCPDWRELRLDIDPRVEPDIVASVTGMAAVADASVDGVWSSHNLEHLWPHEVPVALAEIQRVLRPGGVAVLLVPDLQAVAAAVAEDRLDAPLYDSPAGPITALDVIYGYGPALAAGNHFMAHRTGFTPTTLGRALQQAGFDPVVVRRMSGFELQVRAFRPPVTADTLRSFGIALPPAAG